jgi:hypothetical protein
LYRKSLPLEIKRFFENWMTTLPQLIVKEGVEMKNPKLLQKLLDEGHA